MTSVKNITREHKEYLCDMHNICKKVYKTEGGLERHRIKQHIPVLAATLENEGDKAIYMDMVIEVIEEDINDTAHEGDRTKENIE